MVAPLASTIPGIPCPWSKYGLSGGYSRRTNGVGDDNMPGKVDAKDPISCPPSEPNGGKTTLGYGYIEFTAPNMPGGAEKLVEGVMTVEDCVGLLWKV